MSALTDLESRVAELEKLQQQFIVLAKLYAEPKRVYEGMVVYADGTTWNPGSGAGMYQYRGSTWTFLN